MSILKLKEVNDSATMIVKSCEVVEGQYGEPEAESLECRALNEARDRYYTPDARALNEARDRDYTPDAPQSPLTPEEARAVVLNEDENGHALMPQERYVEWIKSYESAIAKLRAIASGSPE